MLDTYVVGKVGHSLYEVRRYKANSLMEAHTVDLTKSPRSDFETKRMSVARRYASEGAPKGVAYWFGPGGSISRTKLGEDSVEEMTTRKHFQAAASAIRAISDPRKRQEMADFQAHMYAQENPRFDHARFHSAAGTMYGGATGTKK
jgi:hypothetical protein